MCPWHGNWHHSRAHIWACRNRNQARWRIFFTLNSKCHFSPLAVGIVKIASQIEKCRRHMLCISRRHRCILRPKLPYMAVNEATSIMAKMAASTFHHKGNCKTCLEGPPTSAGRRSAHRRNTILRNLFYICWPARTGKLRRDISDCIVHLACTFQFSDVEHYGSKYRFTARLRDKLIPDFCWRA